LQKLWFSVKIQSVKIKTKIGILALVFVFLANPVFAELPSGSSLGPTASFTANSTAVLTGNLVQFDASSSRDASGSSNLQFRWDFEAKYDWTNWTKNSTATHTFKQAGSFAVRLQVKDRDGLIDETALTIHVQTKTIRHVPLAQISVSPQTGHTGTSFYFTVKVFSSVNTPTDRLEVRWDWNHDGKWDTNWSRARDFFHTFSSEGWQEVWLEVRDIDGSSSLEKGFYVVGKENDSLRTKEVGLILVDRATAPRASFQTWPTEISPGTNIHFDAGDSIRASKFRWDFDGDGVFDTVWSDDSKIQRVYRVVGVFDAILEVRNFSGETDRTERVVAVSDSNNILPTAKFTVRNRTNASLGSRTAVLRDEIYFSASGSRDEDGSISRIEARWDFEGDGVFDTTFSTEKTAVHRYTSTGWHTPTLQIRDKRGGLAAAETTIKVVVNTAPRAALKISPLLATRDTNFRFDASGSCDDQTGTSNLDYRFDFDGDGIFDTKFSNSRSKSFQLPKTGKFIATVEVRDHANAVSRATAEFEVADPLSPIAAFTVNPRVGTFATNFQFNASLTHDPSGVGGRLKYRWDFDYRGKDDVSHSTGWTSSPNYRHRFSETGEYKIRLSVKNSVGQQSEFFTKIKVHEESESLAFLRKKGIISDESDPDRLITRAELAKMIVKAAKITARRPSEQQFTDVQPNDWCAPFVAVVSERGWISLKVNFVWQPDGSVNRAEAAKITISALYPQVAEAQEGGLKDVPPGVWYERFANVAIEEDLLSIKNYEFKPAQAITRAEAARMIAKLLEKYPRRFSNLFQSNGSKFHATASSPRTFDAGEFLTSLLKRIQY